MRAGREHAHPGAEADDVRTLDAGAVYCPACGEEVELTAETVAWTEEGEHADFGPGIGGCCGLIFLEHPDGRVEAFEYDAAGVEATP